MEHTMHHHHHNNIPNTQSHHWNYSSPSATPLSSAPLTSTPISNSSLSANNNTWTPPTTRGMKRAMSESDCDDIYSEESSKEQWVSSDATICPIISANEFQLPLNQPIVHRERQLPTDESQEATRRDREEATRQNQFIARRAQATGAISLREARIG